MTEIICTSGQLVVETCWCGIKHAVPKELREHQMRLFDSGQTPNGIYCPLGHSWIPSGEPRYKKVEREKNRAVAEADQARAEAKHQRELREAEQRSHAATRGQMTKLKKRVGNGVCPCCNRHFTNLERHMHTKHPDYSQPEQKQTV